MACIDSGGAGSFENLGFRLREASNRLREDPDTVTKSLNKPYKTVYKAMETLFNRS